MVVLSDNGKVHRVVKQIGQSLGCQESPSDQSMLWRVPEWIILLLQSRNISGLEVLFSHILDDVVSIGQLHSVPPVAVPRLSIHHLDLDRPLFHVDVLLFSFRVWQKHLHAHRNVSLELFCDQVQLNALWQGLQKLLFEVILFLYLLLLLTLGVFDLFLLVFDLLSQLMSLLLSQFLLHLSLFDLFFLFNVLSQLLGFLEILLKYSEFLFLLSQDSLSLIFDFLFPFFHNLSFLNFLLEIELVLSILGIDLACIYSFS